MVRLTFILLLLGLSHLSGGAQTCNPDPAARILLLGDSWSAIMWENKTIRNTLNTKGYGDWTEEGEYTAIPGATAAMWADPSWQGVVRDRLLANPSISIVVLLIGGNDLLAGKLSNGWYVGMNPADEAALYARIESNINTIISNIKNTRPGTKVLICGYDYVNLYNTLGEPTNLLTWDNLGQPTPRQVNDAIIALEQRKINIANADPDVYYVQNLGRMQNKYGYPGFFGAGVAPLPGNVAPNYTPMPGGFRDFPTPTAALAGDGTDPIHLSNTGYTLISSALFDYFFSPVVFKAGINASYKSAGLANDGFVRPNNTKSTAQFRLGRDGGGTYRNIISFATGGLPDNAVITRASILLTRSGSSLLPLPRPLENMDAQLDIKKGNFGSQAALETLDFSASASANDIGCFIGTVSGNSAKLRIDVAAAALGYINTTGNTQFRFYLNDVLSGTTYTAFYDGDVTTTANKPLLEIAYSLPNNRSEELVVRLEPANSPAPLKLSFYPNPIAAGEALNVYLENSGEYVVRDILGRNYVNGKADAGDIRIDLPADMPAGTYFLSTGENGSTAYGAFVVIR